MNDVTVVIKTFLHDPQVIRCIETLKATYPDIRIFVCDDGRVDKTEEMKRLGVDLYLFHGPFDSLGLTGGRNMLLDRVETPYFVICDDDSVWTPEAKLEDLKKLMDVVDLAAGTVRTLGSIGHWEGDLIRSADDGLIYTDRGLNNLMGYEGIRYVVRDLVDEYYIAKTELFKGKKIWDENLHITYEHVDSFLTMRQKGFKVACAPDCIIDHKSHDLPQTSEYSGFRYSRDNDMYRNYLLTKWGYKYLVFFNGTRENLIA